MELHRKITSFRKPRPLWTDDYHVYTVENIKEKEIKINGQKIKLYEYDLTMYDKDEYIMTELQKSKQDNQLAIAQLAMRMGGIQNG